MTGEIFNTAILAFTLVLVGLGVGYLLLRLTPEDKEQL
jgi:cytochrome b6-f complex subunit 7